MPPINEMEKYEFLGNLDPIVFHDFWNIKAGGRKVRYNDSMYIVDKRYKSITVSPVGRFATYLKIIGKDDEFYKELGELIDIVGDIPARASISFAKNHKDLDFNVPKNRLFAAVHVLRKQDPINKKMEQYLKI